MQGAGQPEFVAYVNDELTEKVAQDLINQYWPRGLVIHGGVAAALRANTQLMGSPSFVMVDISTSAEPDAEVRQIMDIYHQSKAVVCIGDRNDVSFYRQITKAGANDYLVKPVQMDDLYSVIINASMQKMEIVSASAGTGMAAAPSRKAKMITVFGAHGGVGSSSTIVNMGWLLAEEFKKNVVLIDLDVHFGTLALSLDIEPSVGFREALENPGRVDKTFIESTLVKATERLSVLATEENLDTYVAFNNTAIELLLEKLGESREFIIIDAPRSALVRVPHLITDADVIILVSELTLSGLRDTVTILTKLRNIAPTKEIRVVINKDRGQKFGQLSVKDFENEIGTKIFKILPDSPEVVAAAMNEGKPMSVVGGKSKIVEALREIVISFDPSLAAAVPAKKAGSLDGLLKKLK